MPKMTDKARVVPNGVDCSKFKPLGIKKPKKPTIGYVGRKASYKISLIPKMLNYYRNALSC
jgi:glycosyltransferase involved in cell wall biosynthesis